MKIFKQLFFLTIIFSVGLNLNVYGQFKNEKITIFQENLNTQKIKERTVKKKTKKTIIKSLFFFSSLILCRIK